jgi:hypothetical protein
MSEKPTNECKCLHEDSMGGDPDPVFTSMRVHTLTPRFFLLKSACLNQKCALIEFIAKKYDAFKALNFEPCSYALKLTYDHL